MPRWSKRRNAKSDDREWSAHTSVHPRMASPDLVKYTALPAETGPTWAPDRLSVWPVEGGRYGIDAHYHGPTGVQRANRQIDRLKAWASTPRSALMGSVDWSGLALWHTAPRGWR